MPSPSKRAGAQLMLLSNPGGKVRRFELKQRHLLTLSCLWLLALAAFFSLGFYL